MKTPGTLLNRWIVLLAVLGCAATSNQAAEPVRARVLTYNIQHGAGTDGKIDLARTAAVIKRLAPDIVALQEVDKATTRSRGVDQAAELGKLTGMHVAFGKAMDFAGGEYGEAILAGDFNDVPDSPAIKVLQPHWTDATSGQPDPTWPSDQPRLKIDYVFFRPVDGWRVVEKQVINESVTSDHRPLLVVLEWMPK